MSAKNPTSVMASDPDHCTCGRRITDVDPEGCEAINGHRYCLDHLPRDADPELYDKWRGFKLRERRGERWWHAFKGECDCGMSTTLVAEDSPEHPEQLARRLGGSIVLMMCVGCDLALSVGYVRSWDHAPTSDEKESVGIEWGE